MRDIYTHFQTEIISLGFALLLALIKFLFRAKAKLVWGTPYGFTFLVQAPAATTAPEDTGTPQVPVAVPPASNIQTASIIVQNLGSQPATEVEVTFNWKPNIYNIWPSRTFDVHTSPDQRFTLKFPNLAPGELFQIELISPGHLPQVMSVRCKECTAKFIPVRPMRVFPNWFNNTAVTLAFLGVAAIIYVVLKAGEILLR